MNRYKLKAYIDWLNSLTWTRLSILLSLLFTVVLLTAGLLFFALGFAHSDMTWKDVAWPPFAIGALVFTGMYAVRLMDNRDNLKTKANEIRIAKFPVYVKSMAKKR